MKLRDSKGRFRKKTRIEILAKHQDLYNIISFKLQVELMKARDKAYDNTKQ